MLTVLTVVCGVVGVPAGNADAQTPGSAVLTRWDIFAATGGVDATSVTATRNPAAIARSPLDGSIWFLSRFPVMRLGRLDPVLPALNYTQWDVPTTAAGTPVGLVVSNTGDIWITNSGANEVIVKLAGTNDFRKFVINSLSGTTALPHRLAVSPDGSMGWVPVRSGSRSGVVRLPLDGSAATRLIYNVSNQDPRHVAFDSAGVVWFTNTVGNRLHRYDPAAAVSGNLKTWTLPAGTGPTGIHIVNKTLPDLGALKVCIASEGGVDSSSGQVMCLDVPAPINSATTVRIFARAPAPGFGYPQQIAGNAASDLFVTEQYGNAVSFISAIAAVTTTFPIVSGNSPLFQSLAQGTTVTTTPSAPVVFTVLPTQTTLTGSEDPAGHVRFSLPDLPPLVDQPGVPRPSRPVGITPATGDTGPATGSFFITESFDGPAPIATQMGGVVSQLTMAGEAPPAFEVIPDSLEFDADLGSTDVLVQQVSIAKAGGGTLAWSATVDKPWVMLSTTAPCATPPEEGTCGDTPATLTVTVDPAGFAAGMQTATITIVDPDGEAEDASVSLTLTIVERPTITVVPTELEFTAVASDPEVPPASQLFQILSAGAVPLEWTATLNLSGLQAQLEVAGQPLGPTVSGVGPAVVTVHIYDVGIPQVLTGSVTIESNATGPIVEVGITYTITDIGEPLSVDQPALTFLAQKGGAVPAPQTVRLSNAASFPMIWGTSLPYSAGPALPAWLTMSPSQATTAGGGFTDILFSVNHAALPAGAHSATIVIDDQPNANAPPVQINLLLTVQAPAVQLSTATVTASIDQGGAVAGGGFSVTNIGDAPLIFTPAVVENNGTGWLSVAPAGVVSIAPGQSQAFTLTIGSASLAPGTFSGQILISDPNSSNGDHTVGVTLTVIADLTPPVLTLPSPAPVEATGVSTPVTFTATASDAVEGSVAVTCAPLSGSGFPVGTTPVTCSAQDSKGNTATGSFNVVVQDTTAPVVMAPANQVLEATTSAGAVATFAATATDAVSAVTITYSQAPGSTFPLGTTTVTVTATDVAANTATATFTIEVVDTTPPTITAPADQLLELTSPAGAVATFAATATDTVSAVTITYSHASGSTFPLGTTTVTATATDAAGNAASATFTMTVQDTTAPVMTAPANQVLEATSAAGAVATFAATATDAAGPPAITYSHPSGSTFPLGTTVVSVMATDASGNVATATFTITVQDTAGPVITAPANQVLEAASAAGAAATFAATAVDNLGGPVTITYSHASGSTFPLGTTTVTVTAQDQSLNTSTETFTIAVQDTTGPVITAPPSQTVEAASSTGAVATFAATATDAVSAVTITYSHASGSTFPLGPTTVTVTATDEANNPSTAAFTIDVVDTTPPTMTAPASQVLELTGQAGAVATFAATAADTVSAVTITYSHPSGSAFPLGTTTVTATATDASGNSASADFIIEVMDTTAPEITPAANQVLEATSAGGAEATFEATATDAAGPPTITYSPAPGSTFALGITTVTATATDGSGNSASTTFTIDVRDTTAPVIAAPASQTVEATSATGATVTFEATATDAVGPVTFTYSHASGSTFPLGTTTVTVTATDDHTNSSTATFTITVQDATGPVITAPANQTVEAASSAGAVATFAATATDAVSAVTITYSHASGSTFPLGPTTVTVTATDEANNTSAATFTIEVVDTTPPVITAPANQVLEATGPAGAVATFAASATDTVSAVTITYSHAPGSTFPLGTTTVTVTAQDAATNTATATFTIQVKDTTPPVLTLPANMTVNATSSAGAIVTFSTTATDVVSGALTPACTPASGSTFPVGTTTVTCTATDAAGNSASGTFTVTVNSVAVEGWMTGAGFLDIAHLARLHFRFGVREREPRGERGHVRVRIDYRAHGVRSDVFASRTVTSVVFSDDPGFMPGRRRPAIDTVVFTGVGEWNGQPGFTYEVRASDRGEPGKALDTFAITIWNPLGVVVVSYGDTLDGGNIQSHRLPGRIPAPPDEIAPVIDLPHDIVEEATSAAGAKVTYRVSARDNVDGRVDVACTPDSRTVFPLGVTIVNCMASDGAGNVAMRTFTVTVRDTKAPRLHLPGPITVKTPAGAPAVVTFAVSASDNVTAAPVVSCTPPSGSLFPKGTTTVSCSAVDLAGNTAPDTFRVTVKKK